MKKALRCLLVILCVALGIYVIMFLDTNSIYNEVKTVMKGEYDEDYVFNGEMYCFDFTRGYGETEVDLDVKRLFVVHNFQHGYMWVFYSFEVKSPSGYLLTGGADIPSKWEIERQNGKWVIVDVIEAP